MYREIGLFIKIRNFNDRLETWWGHQESHMTLDTILVYFIVLCSTTISQKFHSQDLTNSWFMTEYLLLPPSLPPSMPPHYPSKLFHVKEAQAG